LKFFFKLRDLYILTETLASQIEQFFGFVEQNDVTKQERQTFLYLSGSLHFNRHNQDKGTNLREERVVETLKEHLDRCYKEMYS